MPLSYLTSAQYTYSLSQPLRIQSMSNKMYRIQLLLYYHLNKAQVYNGVSCYTRRKHCSTNYFNWPSHRPKVILNMQYLLGVSHYYASPTDRIAVSLTAVGSLCQ